jgi:AbrB family looped-hinge helix DNA binding protein
MLPFLTSMLVLYYDFPIDKSERAMQAVTVSPKFQVVIPQAVRQALGLVPGVKLQVVHFENRIELIPVRSSKSLRGSLRGIDTSVPRERDRT